MPYTYGLGNMYFGVPAITGYVTNAYDITNKCALVATVANESGVIVTRHYDDLTKEISLDVTIDGATTPDPGTLFQYPSGVYYICQDTQIKGNDKDFVKAVIKGITSAGISIP